MPLDVNVSRKDQDQVTVTPIGSIDTNTSVMLEKQVDSIISDRPKVLVFDMAGVDFMSSAGVRVVFKTKKNMESIKGIFTLINLKPQIKKVFDIINALPSLAVFESVKELDDYLAAMQKKEMEKKGGF